jgi:serine/threonine-protein kinase
MVTAVTPSPVHYRLLSEHFQACADLSDQEREEYLSGPNIKDLSLREELRSLLEYHGQPSRSSTMSPVALPADLPSVRAWFRGPTLAPLMILGVSTLLLVLGVRFWCLSRLEATYKAEGVLRLQQVLENRASSIRSWASRKKELVRSTLEDPSIVSHATALAEAAHSSRAPEEALRTSPSYAFLFARMTQAAEGLGEKGFSMFTPAGLVLCSDENGAVGRSLSPAAAAVLRGPALGEWTVSRPYPDRQLGLQLDPERTQPVMYAGGPIRGGHGQVVAVVVFFFSPQAEFYPFLSSPGAAELLAFDDRGLLLNNLKDPTALTGSGLLGGTAGDQSALRIRLRDPGEEVKAGRRIETSSDQWAPTRMCLSAIQGMSGSDAVGYRNLIGRPVVGSWLWLPEQGMGLAAEEEVDTVLASLQPLRSSFMLLLCAPALLMGFLFFMYGCGRRANGRGGDSRFGFYVVDRPIGQGGMGDVFLATHSILSRPAALKILRELRPSEATVARFKREARMASRLGHPNSIQIFDYGESSDGRLYYAMEYVDGLNLAQLLTLEGPLSFGRSLYLLKQISGALEEAHAVGLLHRDLKPSNIMVGRKGGLGDVVKILDFGIASSVSGVPEDITRSNNLVGTPAYLAPERIRRPHQLDFRSDVYSFGGVAFHMLTGRSLFEGPGPTELIYQVLTSKRPSPSKLRGDPLPDALESLILDCLSIEPELRPSSMGEITAALKAVETAEPWSQDEARNWWASNRERVAQFRGALP